MMLARYFIAAAFLIAGVASASPPTCKKENLGNEVCRETDAKGHGLSYYCPDWNPEGGGRIVKWDGQEFATVPRADTPNGCYRVVSGMEGLTPSAFDGVSFSFAGLDLSGMADGRRFAYRVAGPAGSRLERLREIVSVTDDGDPDNGSVTDRIAVSPRQAIESDMNTRVSIIRRVRAIPTVTAGVTYLQLCGSGE